MKKQSGKMLTAAAILMTGVPGCYMGADGEAEEFEAREGSSDSFVFFDYDNDCEHGPGDSGNLNDEILASGGYLEAPAGAGLVVDGPTLGRRNSELDQLVREHGLILSTSGGRVCVRTSVAKAPFFAIYSEGGNIDVSDRVRIDSSFTILDASAEGTGGGDITVQERARFLNHAADRGEGLHETRMFAANVSLDRVRIDAPRPKNTEDGTGFYSEVDESFIAVGSRFRVYGGETIITSSWLDSPDIQVELSDSHVTAESLWIDAQGGLDISDSTVKIRGVADNWIDPSLYLLAGSNTLTWGGARLDTNTAPTEAYFEGVLQGEVTIKHEDRFDAEYW